MRPKREFVTPHPPSTPNIHTNSSMPIPPAPNQRPRRHQNYHPPPRRRPRRPVARPHTARYRHRILRVPHASAQACTALMLLLSIPRAGRTRSSRGLGRGLCRSMRDRGFVLGVSFDIPPHYLYFCRDAELNCESQRILRLRNLHMQLSGSFRLFLVLYFRLALRRTRLDRRGRQLLLLFRALMAVRCFFDSRVAGAVDGKG